MTDRFGALVRRRGPPEAVGWAQDLVGDEPDVYEEFDSRVGQHSCCPRVELVALLDRERAKRRAHILA